MMIISTKQVTVRYILGVLAAITLCGLTGTANAATYTSKKGYTISYPAGWTLNTTGMMGTDLILFAAPIQKFAPNLNVTVVSMASTATLAKEKAGLATLYPKIFTKYVLISSRITKHAGVDVLELTGTYLMGSNKLMLRMHQMMALRGGKLVNFTTTVPNSSHAAYDAAFDQMLSSVRWTAASASATAR